MVSDVITQALRGSGYTTLMVALRRSWDPGRGHLGRPWGGEVLGVPAVAVHARVLVHWLREMIYAYPTFHRAIEAAVHDLSGE
jgi:hypothetical protein